MIIKLNKECLMIKNRKCNIIVLLDHIDYIITKKFSKNIEFRLVNDLIITRSTLLSSMEALDKSFIKLNRSVIINMGNIRRVIKDHIPYVEFNSGNTLYISVYDLKRLENHIISALSINKNSDFKEGIV